VTPESGEEHQGGLWRGRVERIGWGGLGVGRLDDGRIILLSAGLALLPGEEVEAETTQHPRHVEGRVLRWLSPSTLRAEPACPLAGRCGGCDLWGAGELASNLKRAMVADLLHRQLRAETEQLAQPWDWLAAPATARRQRVQLHWDGTVLGFYERGSHRIVAAQACPMAAEAISAAIPALHEWLAAGGTPDPPLQRWELSCGTPAEFVVATCAEFPGRAWRLSESGWQADRAALRHELGEAMLLQSSAAFFQTSPAWAWEAFGTVFGGWELSGERLYDLYGGGGFFSVLLGARFSSGLLVESSGAAVRDARANLSGRPWRIEQLDVETGLARHCTPQQPLGTAEDVVILDPPRSGLSPGVCASLQHCGAGQLVLVGCDGASFCRDVKRLAPRWKLIKLAAIDLFPNTVHVEFVGLFEPNKTDG
jgi:23S rRNA (uracil1939-C5)-methyltransferase